MERFDTIDIFFIALISAYFITLGCFIIALICKMLFKFFKHYHKPAPTNEDAPEPEKSLTKTKEKKEKQPRKQFKLGNLAIIKKLTAKKALATTPIPEEETKPEEKLAPKHEQLNIFTEIANKPSKEDQSSKEAEISTTEKELPPQVAEIKIAIEPEVTPPTIEILPENEPIKSADADTKKSPEKAKKTEPKSKKQTSPQNKKSKSSNTNLSLIHI